VTAARAPVDVTAGVIPAWLEAALPTAAAGCPLTATAAYNAIMKFFIGSPESKGLFFAQLYRPHDTFAQMHTALGGIMGVLAKKLVDPALVDQKFPFPLVAFAGDRSVDCVARVELWPERCQYTSLDLTRQIAPSSLGRPYATAAGNLRGETCPAASAKHTSHAKVTLPNTKSSCGGLSSQLMSCRPLGPAVFRPFRRRNGRQRGPFPHRISPQLGSPALDPPTAGPSTFQPDPTGAPRSTRPH
jgi:hypothetical protein